MELTRTFDLLENYRLNYPDKDDALAGKQNGEWIKYSTSQYIQYSTWCAYGLLALGLKKGDKVATISNNRPEWNFMDMGLSMTGIWHLPIYPTISIDEYKYILNHAKPKFIVVSDKILYNKLKDIVEQSDLIEDIYTFNEVEGAKNWKEILNLGKTKQGEFKRDLKTLMASIVPKDVVTMIYTSGTTGCPKGVMLTHRNLVSNFIATAAHHQLNSTHKALSFLPLSHVYERMMNYHFQYKGMSIYYAENMGTIVDNMKEVKPDMFNTVPRLLERVYAKIIETGKNLPWLKKKIFFQAIDLGKHFEYNQYGHYWYKVRLFLANWLIYSKWRAALGGNVKVIVCGGAQLQPRLTHIFGAAGMPVLEGYGLTETSPVIAVNNLTTYEIRISTVGIILKGVEVKFADDGEILCKGPGVMLGYYKQPGLTEEAIDEDGWFHTGDIGVMVDEKYLKITDRKKEIFKLSSGKYIAPQSIENKLKESFFIEQVMIIGENEKFASALVSPDFGYLQSWCEKHKIKYQDECELIHDPEVINRYQREIAYINKFLGKTEQVKRFRLVEDVWTSQTGELSPTLKLKRKILFSKYKDLIQEIYAVGNN